MKTKMDAISLEKTISKQDIVHATVNGVRFKICVETDRKNEFLAIRAMEDGMVITPISSAMVLIGPSRFKP